MSQVPLLRQHEQMIATLQHDCDAMVDYLLMKVNQGDWHGVADAAMDIRELEAKISVYKELDITTYVKTNNGVKIEDV